MLKNRLRDMKLAGIANSIDERIVYANQQQLSYGQFLELLFEDEENNRRDNSYKKRYARAKFPAHKIIEEFDFNFQPSIDKRQINDAATCQYIAEKRNIIFIGSPGTGKTHLAISLGIKALLKSHKVLFTSVSEMLYQLHVSKADNTYYKKLNDYLSVDLLILDELGFKKLPQYSADDFFEVISKRYEKGSSIITTNKHFEQWGDIFADHILSSAILDRIVHHSMIFQIKGSSFRAKDIKKLEEKKENDMLMNIT
jgi:DNA replication protein DnaC